MNTTTGTPQKPQSAESIIKDFESKPNPIASIAIAQSVSLYGNMSKSTGGNPNLEIVQRHSLILDAPANQRKIAIMGTGTMGGHVAVLTARMGYRSEIYDFDKVEIHNLGHQPYRIQDIGKLKVEALREIVAESCGLDLIIHNAATDGKNVKCDILVLAVDSMAARKEIAANAQYDFCIDIRSGGETFNIFAFSALQKERYDKTLYSDTRALELPCGAKSIGYVSYIAAGLITDLIKKIILAETVPFETNFCAKNLILSTTI